MLGLTKNRTPEYHESISAANLSEFQPRAILKKLWFLAVALVLSALGVRVQAFSLLGPYADWMQQTNNFREPGDIGGPMDITEGYRWNVPVVTYGFDKSFVGFFGPQGVAAVESAIKILNDLPPASTIVVTNYPFDASRRNYVAASQSLIDLKSVALSLVVGHLGLAAPSRNIFVVRRWDPFIPDNTVEVSWPPGTVPDYIWERNFDPGTLAPTAYLNGLLFAGNYIQQAGHAEVQLFPADPDVPLGFTVADGFSGISPFGAFYTGLSYDDVGGLRFLLNQTNVNYETLLPDVQLAPGSDPQQKLVDGAWRAGVEKITFVQQSFDSEWQPIPMTVPFTGTYFTNGIVMQQAAQRVVSQPDFLFCAGDNGPPGYTAVLYGRTGTAAWNNNAAMNGNPAALGPGVIQPQVRIVFQKLGLAVITDPIQPGRLLLGNAWGSFDDSTNTPVVFPCATAASTNGLMIRFAMSGALTNVWQVPLPPGGQAALQLSTNLADWVSVATVTNSGAIVEWQLSGTALPCRFFRVLPQ